MPNIVGISSVVDFATPVSVQSKIDALIAAIPDPENRAGASSPLQGHFDKMDATTAIRLYRELRELRRSLISGTGSAPRAVSIIHGYVAVAGDVTNGYVTFVHELGEIADIVRSSVSVVRAGVALTTAPTLSIPGGTNTVNIRVANTAGGYAVTAGDIFYATIVGSTAQVA